MKIHVLTFEFEDWKKMLEAKAWRCCFRWKVEIDIVGVTVWGWYLKFKFKSLKLKLEVEVWIYFENWKLITAGGKKLLDLQVKKSQNCVKAAIAFVCTTSKRQLLFALLQWITFVCTSAIENILCTAVIIKFCMH